MALLFDNPRPRDFTADKVNASQIKRLRLLVNPPGGPFSVEVSLGGVDVWSEAFQTEAEARAYFEFWVNAIETAK